MGCCTSKISKDIKYKDCVPFVPPIKTGRVVKVYDGDTITVACKIPGLKNSPVYRFSVRLAGIDAPEMVTKNEEEKEMAKKARDCLSKEIMDKDVVLKHVKTEKYGRVLCDVYLDNLHINEWMLEKRFAVKYNGKAKSVVDWKKYHEET